MLIRLAKYGLPMEKSHGQGWAMGIFLGLAALIWKIGKMDGWADIDGSDIKPDKGFNVYRRAWLTTRPDPEGDRSLS
nr:hypothetical protein BaRGS_008981 [Batillaria attramentaria]